MQLLLEFEVLKFELQPLKGTEITKLISKHQDIYQDIMIFTKTSNLSTYIYIYILVIL